MSRVTPEELPTFERWNVPDPELDQQQQLQQEMADTRAANAENAVLKQQLADAQENSKTHGSIYRHEPYGDSNVDTAADSDSANDSLSDSPASMPLSRQRRGVATIKKYRRGSILEATRGTLPKKNIHA